jgi:hypothetical protein
VPGADGEYGWNGSRATQKKVCWRTARARVSRENCDAIITPSRLVIFIPTVRNLRNPESERLFRYAVGGGDDGVPLKFTSFASVRDTRTHERHNNDCEGD